MMSEFNLFVSTSTAERIDRWIATQLPNISRSRLQKLIEEGQVKLNGVPCTEKKHLLNVGDQIQVLIPPVQPVNLVPESIPLNVLYEDDHILVINKPKNTVVHPSAGHKSGTLVNALLAHCQYLSGINGEERPGIVHRLDKDTTGALIIAKSDHAHHHLQAQIQAKTAQRIYLGVVWGGPTEVTGRIDAPIGRHPIDRKKMAVLMSAQARSAVTKWQVLERLGHYTLIQFQLETGRTHQIRVHAAYMKWPLVGDPDYSSLKKTPIKLNGQALHAWKLIFQHPQTEAWITCVAPLPHEFERLLQRLRQFK